MYNYYWSKKNFDKRVKEYQQDIKHARLVKQHLSDYEARVDQTSLINSLVWSLKFHRIAYKVLRGGKSLFD